MPTDRQLSDAEMLELLDWYRAAGVDLAVGEAPVDRFAAATSRDAGAARAAAVPARPDAARAAPPAGVGHAGNDDAAAAEALAAGAGTLDALRAAMEGFDGCALKLRATQLVFADGNPEAEVMLIGEAPGREEDLQGKPFVGRSGQLLDRMLAAIGLDRSKVFICNTVPWRPPGNRNPTPGEIATCLPFLYRQVELVSPRLIVTLGAAATETVFGAPMSILKARGRWQDLTVGSVTVRAMPTLHPAYLLRQPGQKHLSWQDMLSLKRELERVQAD